MKSHRQRNSRPGHNCTVFECRSYLVRDLATSWLTPLTGTSSIGTKTRNYKKLHETTRNYIDFLGKGRWCCEEALPVSHHFKQLHNTKGSKSFWSIVKLELILRVNSLVTTIFVILPYSVSHSLLVYSRSLRLIPVTEVIPVKIKINIYLTRLTTYFDVPRGCYWRGFVHAYMYREPLL